MPITFSDHAKKQLKRRKIPQKLTIQTIRNPETTVVSFKGRRLRRRDFDGKILEVVTKTEGARITVITGYYLNENL